MDSKEIFGGSLRILEKSLDLRSRRHNLIASNISNMDTPGYKGFDILVDEELNKISGKSKGIRLEMTNPAHLPISKAFVGDIEYRMEQVSPVNMRGDGNTVDIDKEMTKMAENTLLYNASAQILSKKFLALKTVIKDGK